MMYLPIFFYKGKFFREPVKKAPAAFLNFVLHAETVLEGFDKTTPGKDFEQQQQQDQHDTPHNQIKIEMSAERRRKNI